MLLIISFSPGSLKMPVTCRAVLVQVQLMERGIFGNSTRCGYSGYSEQEMKLVALCSLLFETAAGWPTFNSAWSHFDFNQYDGFPTDRKQLKFQWVSCSEMCTPRTWCIRLVCCPSHQDWWLIKASCCRPPSHFHPEANFLMPLCAKDSLLLALQLWWMRSRRSWYILRL